MTDQHARQRVEGVVAIFDRPGGWWYVAVPRSTTEGLAHLADRGVIAVSARIGPVKWDTSLLPMGDDSHFIALNRKVRDRNDLHLGDPVVVEFSLRKR